MQLGREFPNTAALKIFAFHQRAVLDRQLLQLLDQQGVQMLVGFCFVKRGNRGSGREPGERVTLKQTPVSLSATTAIQCRCPGQHGEPAPESVFTLEGAGMTGHASVGLLQGVAGCLLVTARDYEQVAQQPIEVSGVESAESFFIASCECRCQK